MEQKSRQKQLELASKISEIDRLLNEINSEYNIDRPELLNILEKKKESKEKHQIPDSIFVKELSVLECIVKYLREEEHLSFKEIARLLYRSEIPMGITYRRAAKKFDQPLNCDSLTYIDLKEFSNKKLSPLESVVKTLKDNSRLNFAEISKILKKDARTIWTVYSRVKEKLK